MMENGGLGNKDFSVVCGDLDQTMVDLAAQRIKENGWPAKAELLDAQVTTFPFSTSRKDQVLTVETAEESSLQRQLLYPCPYEFWASISAGSPQSSDR